MHAQTHTQLHMRPVRSHSRERTMAVIEHAYENSGVLAEAVAVRLREACISALAHRGHALLCLAGGRTPLPIYRQLASSPHIDWEDVAVLPGDDRCVPWDHAASNVASLRNAFAEAGGVRIAALTTPDGDPGASLQHARTVLSRHADTFDAVVLGMGEDAHTASLFPGARGLSAAMAHSSREDAFLIHPEPLPPEAPYPRITLGLARLLRTRSIHLIVTGQRKREVLREAMAGDDVLRHPIAGVLQSARDVHVHWSP
jgi:6-phosphogluconolactonase